MLTKIELQNFKCFQEKTVFSLGRLTLLTGINGQGKSSLIQSLLLMRQSIEYNDRTIKLILNGNCLNLGGFNEIRNTHTSREKPIVFKYFHNNVVNSDDGEIITTQGSADYSFVEDMKDDMVATLKSVEIEANSSWLLTNDSRAFHEKFEFDQDEQDDQLLHFVPTYIQILEKKIEYQKLLNFSAIHYISADRLGPQDFYFRSTIPKFPNVGLKGELTVNLLYRMKDELIDDRLCLGADAKTLIIQTQEWLNKIFDGAKVEVFGSQTNVLELMFNSSLSKDRFRPANIGFGYHCILPIIVSGLIAKEGEILIVENPEAHLHPKAQSELAKFLAKISACGIQVFIESHSDHILNALRIAVLDNILSHEELSILYFSQNTEQSVVQIPLHSDGKIEEWPDGFFDQMDKDFERLFEI